jgi:hypothetical protein
MEARKESKTLSINLLSSKIMLSTLLKSLSLIKSEALKPMKVNYPTNIRPKVVLYLANLT